MEKQNPLEILQRIIIKVLWKLILLFKNNIKIFFDDGFEVNSIIKNISLIDPNLEFIDGKTLIFFDELQDCINCATSLKKVLMKMEDMM